MTNEEAKRGLSYLNGKSKISRRLWIKICNQWYAASGYMFMEDYLKSIATKRRKRLKP